MKERFLDFTLANDIMSRTDRDLTKNMPVMPVKRFKMESQPEQDRGFFSNEAFNNESLIYQSKATPSYKRGVDDGKK